VCELNIVSAGLCKCFGGYVLLLALNILFDQSAFLSSKSVS